MNRPNKNEDLFKRYRLALALVARVVRNSLPVPEGATTTYLLALVAWAVFQPALPAAEGQP